MSGDSPQRIYRPTFMPSFVPDGNGGLRLDSAGMAATMGMERHLLANSQTQQGHIQLLEHEEHLSRQKKVDSYLESLGVQNPIYKNSKGREVVLPRLASPQRIHSNLFEKTEMPDQQALAARAQQLKQLDGSIVGLVLQKDGYKDLDAAILETNRRRTEIINFQKQKLKFFQRRKDGFNPVDRTYILQPINDTLESFNNVAIKLDLPLRFVWRKTLETCKGLKIDLWIIYANTLTAAPKGPNAWMGSRDIIVYE